MLDYLDTLDSDNEGGAVTRQVRDVLADAVAAGASELAMSSRTLQRRLSEEGTTFRDVLADGVQSARWLRDLASRLHCADLVRQMWLVQDVSAALEPPPRGP